MILINPLKMTDMEKLIISPQTSRNIAALLCLLTILVGAIGVCGWIFHIPIITTFLPQMISMKFNTAICLILSGIALRQLCPEKIKTQTLVIATLLSIILFIIATVTLCEYVLNTDFGIDQLFVMDTQVLKNELPGRMALVTAINFILIAISLMLMMTRKFPAWSYQICQCLMFPLILTTVFLYILHFMLGSLLLYSFYLSLPTIIGMASLNAAFMLARPQTGISLILLGDTFSGKVARITLPFIIIIPPFVNVLIRYGVKFQLYEDNFADLLTVLLEIEFIAILLYIALYSIRNKDINEFELKKILTEKEILFNEFAENIGSVLWRSTPNMDRMLYVSPAYEKIWGKSTASLYQKPHTWLDSIVPADRQKTADAFQRMIDQNMPHAAVTYKIVDANGSIRTIYDNGFPLKDKAGVIVARLGIATDVTEMYKSQIRSRLIHDIHFVLSLGHKVEFVAKEIMSLICQELNYDIGELWLLNEKTNALDCIAIWHHDVSLSSEMKLSIPVTKEYEDNFRVLCFNQKLIQYSTHPLHLKNAYIKKDGSIYNLKECFGIPLQVNNKKIGIMIFFNRQLTEQAYDTYDLLKYIVADLCQYLQSTAIQSRIDYLEKYDLLTGIYNRTAFEERLNDLIQRKPRSIAILKIMLVNLSMLNDVMGYDTGNQLLKHLSDTLSAYLTSGDDMLAVIGDGRFGLILYEPDYTRVTALANSVLQTVKNPIHINNHDVHINLNIGISIYPENGKTNYDLMANADIALMESEKEGMNLFKFSDIKTQKLISNQIKMENDMYRALKNNEFEVYYQPKLALDSSTIAGVEALIRWNDPSSSVRLPDEFIPVCERSGLITELGAYVLRRSMMEMLKDNMIVPVAINLSMQQFIKSYDLTGIIKQIVTELNVNPEYLELELTESILMSEPQRVLQILSDLQNIGIKIAFDDFGTGYSSMKYLVSFIPNMLKIDKTFINGLPADKRSIEITLAIIALAHSLGVKVIAEGVETEAQVKTLREAKCDQIQGFYFSSPLPLHELRMFMKKYQLKH